MAECSPTRASFSRRERVHFFMMILLTWVAWVFRRLGEGHDFQFDDDGWVVSKIPFSHGYSNLSIPLYWYVKNEAFLKKMVFVTQQVRIEPARTRAEFPSDNAYADALVHDILLDPIHPTVSNGPDVLPKTNFKWTLKQLAVQPNNASMQVHTNAPAFLIFNNVDFPGWSVYVNGQQRPLLKTNQIFQGVFLDCAGTFDVVFKFRPIGTIFLLLIPYLVLACSLILYVFQRYTAPNLRI